MIRIKIAVGMCRYYRPQQPSVPGWANKEYQWVESLLRFIMSLITTINFTIKNCMVRKNIMAAPEGISNTYEANSPIKDPNIPQRADKGMMVAKLRVKSIAVI